jgi:HEPN domain-containing protein
MADGESTYPHDWFRIAVQDLDRARKRLAEGDVDDAAFRLQQAVEKALKGYLLSRGWVLRRIHDVEALLTDAVAHHRALERYRALCRDVAGYYLIERYPTFEEGPSRADVRRAYRRATGLLRLLRRLAMRGGTRAQRHGRA